MPQEEISIRVRPVVAEFAIALERRLAQADSNGAKHWLSAESADLAQKCAENARRATHPAFPGDLIAIRSAIDAGNYALFLWDKLRDKPSTDRSA